MTAITCKNKTNYDSTGKGRICRRKHYSNSAEPFKKKNFHPALISSIEGVSHRQRSGSFTLTQVAIILVGIGRPPVRPRHPSRL